MNPHENIYYNNINDTWNVPGLKNLCIISSESLVLNRTYVHTMIGVIQKFFDPTITRTQNYEVIDTIWTAWEHLALGFEAENIMSFSKKWITHYPNIVEQHIRKRMMLKLKNQELLNLLPLAANLAESQPQTRGIIKNLSKRLEQRSKISNAADLSLYKFLKIGSTQPEDSYWKTLLDDYSSVAKEMRTLYSLSYAGYLVSQRDLKKENVVYHMPEKNSQLRTTVSATGARWERVFYATSVPDTPISHEVSDCITFRTQCLVRSAMILDRQQCSNDGSSLHSINSYNELSGVLYDQEEKITTHPKNRNGSLFDKNEPSKLRDKITAARLWCKQGLIWTDSLITTALESTAPIIEDYCAKHKIKPQKIQDLCVFLLGQYINNESSDPDHTHRIVRHLILLEPHTLLELVQKSREHDLIWTCLANPWALKQPTREALANSPSVVAWVGSRLASDAGFLIQRKPNLYDTLNLQSMPIWAQDAMALDGKVGDALRISSFKLLNFNTGVESSIKDITEAYFNHVGISLKNVLSLYQGLACHNTKENKNALVPFIESLLEQKQNNKIDSISIPELVFE